MFTFLWALASFWTGKPKQAINSKGEREENDSEKDPIPHGYYFRFLLCGLSRAGKTCIFSKFAKEERMIDLESTTRFSVGGNFVDLIDLPGYYSLREKYFNKYKTRAHAIIFVLDSIKADVDRRSITGALHSIVSDLATMDYPFAIVCNKQDSFHAKNLAQIKNILEFEMNKARYTSVLRTDEIGDNAHPQHFFIGHRNSYFKFEQLDQPLEFLACSAKNNDLESLKEWIEKTVELLARSHEDESQEGIGLKILDRR